MLDGTLSNSVLSCCKRAGFSPSKNVRRGGPMYKNKVPTKVIAAVRTAGLVALMPFFAVSIIGFGCTLINQLYYIE